MRILKRISFILIVISAVSCRNVKDVAYFQPTDSSTIERKVVYPNFNKDKGELVAPAYENIIQTSDILSIYVSSLSPEASSFFNAIAPIERDDQSSYNSYTTKTDIGYTVDNQGYIELPLVGKIKIVGLTTSVAKDTITKRLENYLQYPSVRIYIENFRVTLLGEVFRPGIYKVTNEKITIPEAIGMAGDLNIFANRKNITLIREEKNGEKKYITIDLTKRDLFNSPFYYLRSGDILYVSPVKGRVAQSDNAYRILPLILTSITLILVIANQFSKN